MTLSDIKKLAKLVIAEAKDMGFVVQRYDAYRTNSVYLKLDYGVSHSIRISDHPGKKHLSYRFNLLTNLDKGYEFFDKSKRSFYAPTEFKNLLHDIKYNRDKQLEKYGDSGYQSLMALNKKEGMNKSGFWSQAKIV